MKTCAVYARVSTDMQGESLENQVEYAREYIRRLGAEYTLDEGCVYTDFDQSGYYTRFLQRPAIQKALEDAKTGQYDVIVFKEISRISRDQAEHIEIVSRFTQHGVRIIAINDNLDSERPETLDLLGIHSVMSELESKRISSRVSSGKKSLARRGYWIGEPPIGYVVNPETRRLEIDESYAETVRTVFRLFTEERLGTFKIAEYLNREGLHTKHGRLWSRVTVNRILKNPAYVGDFVYGRTRNALKRVFDETGYTKIKGRDMLPEEDWVVMEGTHPALVDRDVFSRAHALMNARARQNPRRSKHPLTGILKCGKCGSGMVCQVQRSKGTSYRYYSCSRAFRFGRHLCSQPNLNADKLEALIKAHLLATLQPYRYAEVKVAPKKKQGGAVGKAKRLEGALERAHLGLERILVDTEIPEQTMQRMKIRFVDTIQDLQAQLEQLRADEDEVRNPGESTPAIQVDDYLQYIRSLSAPEGNDDLEELRRLFHSLFACIVVEDYQVREIVTKYLFPT